MTEGFYRAIGEGEDLEIQYGPNNVWHKDYQLAKALKDTYSYPVDGWYWFDSEADALAFFG